MHNMLENPVFLKIKEMLSAYVSLDEETFSELSLDEIFSGNVFNCGIFLLNFSETYGFNQPIESFKIDLKKTYLCDLIELVNKKEVF